MYSVWRLIIQITLINFFLGRRVKSAHTQNRNRHSSAYYLDPEMELRITVKITETLQKKMSFWFWSRSKSPFYPKMAKFKPSMLLKYRSKASFNHWFMCLISHGTRIVKIVELGVRINLLVVRYVDISYFTFFWKPSNPNDRHSTVDYYDRKQMLLMSLTIFCLPQPLRNDLLEIRRHSLQRRWPMADSKTA